VSTCTFIDEEYGPSGAGKLMAVALRPTIEGKDDRRRAAGKSSHEQLKAKHVCSTPTRCEMRGSV
jgi:hypothetical protein